MAACARVLSAACESQCAPVCHMAVEVMVSSMRIGQIECVVKYESTRAVVHSLLVPLGPQLLGQPSVPRGQLAVDHTA